MIKISAIGKQCPVPLIMTKNAIAKNGAGEYLVEVDNKIAVQNLEKMAKEYNFNFSFKNNEDKYFEVMLTVKDSSVVNEVKIEGDSDIGCLENINSNNTVVVISSDQMGQGDFDLGNVLIKGCIYAFSQLKEPPKTFIFYNSGVKLVCKGSDNIEDLKKLITKDVKIYACGTCLEHYGIKEKLEVGEVTNMYDIVDMLNNASKIIAP